jgi:glycosyltransferase involved in cell wall biosynthesis
VAPSVAKSDGGPAEVLRGLIPGLRNHGVDAQIVTTDKGLQHHDQELIGMDWVRVEHTIGSASATLSPSLTRFVQSVVDDFDLVHVHGLQSHPGTSAMAAARRARVPYVIQPHGALNSFSWDRHRGRKRAYALTFDRRNWGALAGSIYSSDLELRESQSVLKHVPASLVPLGVDDALFNIEPTAVTGAAYPTVLYLGRITRIKRLDILLEAMSKRPLRELGARLIVAGAPDRSLHFDPATLVDEYGLRGHVDFVGTVDRDGRRALLEKASVFVLPSEGESFGLAVAEAMSAGVPVVTTTNVGIAEAAEEAGALRTAPLSSTAFARAIAAVLSGSYARSLGARGRLYARERFTWANAALETRKVYSRVLETLS